MAEEIFDLKSLVNAPFELPLGDKTFMVKKASLTEIQQYLDKVESFPTPLTQANNIDLVAYAAYLVIHLADNTITEQWVKDNIPGTLATNPMPFLVMLGFIDPQKANLMAQLQAAAIKKIGDESTQP